MLEHLPSIEHRHEPESCQCGQCGKDLIKIGEDITEQLDVEPAKFFVHRHIRPQYACRDCETITAAPIPPAIINGGMAAVGLLVWVLISKYVDHLPLYRLEQIAARDQVILSRSTLAEWVGRTGVALQPLVDRLTELLLERGTLHADETPVAQLDPGSGKTKPVLSLSKGRPIFGLTAATTWNPVRRLSSSTTSRGEAGNTRASFWGLGKAIYWSMITRAIRLCFPANASRHRLARSWAAGRIRAGSFSTCTKPIPALWRWKR